MQPDKPAQTPAPPENPTRPPDPNKRDYDFIFEEQKASQKGGLLKIDNGNKKRRIFIVAAGALGLLVIIYILFTIIGSGSKSQTQALIGIAQEQTEIGRVAGLGVQKTRSAQAKNLATTTQFSMQTSQQQMVALLNKRGHKLDSGRLGLKKDTKTDAALVAAGLNNKYDETFIKVVTDSLKEYQIHVKAAYDNSKSQEERKVLEDSFNNAGSLLNSQAAAAEQSTEE